VALDEVLQDRAGLRERVLAVGDHGRLAERMHRLELWGRQHRLAIPLVALHLVLELELLGSQRTRCDRELFKVVDDDHPSDL